MFILKDYFEELTLIDHWIPNIPVPTLVQNLAQKLPLHFQHSLNLQSQTHSKFLLHGDPPVYIINMIGNKNNYKRQNKRKKI